MSSLASFAALVRALDESPRTLAREPLLARWFAAAAAEDAAWALWLLSGHRAPRLLAPAEMAGLVASAAGIPAWLVEECRRTAGDLAEAAAQILDALAPMRRAWSLHALLGERWQELAASRGEARLELLVATWREVESDERTLLDRLLLGTFRPRVTRDALARGLAEARGGDAPRIAHALETQWQPTPAAYAAIVAGDAGRTLADGPPARPQPLAAIASLAGEPHVLGEPGEHRIEWLPIGIRAQLARRDGDALLWSERDELLSPRLPEIVAAAAMLPAGAVVDGIVVVTARQSAGAGPALERRLARERSTARLLREAPAALVALDLLASGGDDLRSRPLAERLARLRDLLAAAAPGGGLSIPAALPAGSWQEVAALREEARTRGATGLLLRRLDAPYRAGEASGWWSWESPRLRARVVLLYAERSDAGRGSLYSQLTLGVWDGDDLVPVAKLAAGLDDAPLLELDRWVRRNILEAFGPVRRVRPELVFELDLAAVRASGRHKAGVVLADARLLAWRRDLTAADADTLATLRGHMLPP